MKFQRELGMFSEKASDCLGEVVDGARKISKGQSMSERVVGRQRSDN